MATIRRDSTGDTVYAYKATTGELSSVTYPDLKKISYTYNNVGLRSAMTDPFGYTSYYAYDNRNRLKTVSPTLNAVDADATYEYWNNNLVKNVKQKNGVTSAYTYEGYQLDTLTEKKATEPS